VFTIHELKAICDQSATTFIEDRQQVLSWQDSLGGKYSDLPGMCKVHNHVVKAHNGNVEMKVREKCFTGDVEGFTILCSSQHCRWFQPPSTVSATFTVFQLRKCPIWLPCMTVSFLLIVVQITTTDCCIVYTTWTAHTPAPTPTPSTSSTSGGQRRRKKSNKSKAAMDLDTKQSKMD